jgi:mono/diheme cytochrome c family protein
VKELSWARMVVLTALGAGGCGTLWPADMDQQPIVRPLQEARPAPVGSIPLGGIEVLDDREDVADAKPPFPLNAEAAARGRAIYAIHCVSCHGPSGRGDGRISDKFPQAPNLRHVSICKRSDGFIYGTLTAGGRAMPTMREGTSSRDRWDLVAFVRSLQAEGCLTPPASPEGGGQ